MLCALLLSATISLPSHAGVEPAGPVQTTTRIELVARVGETRFAAFNPGDEPQVLLLGNVGGAAPRALLLAPGASFEARFPAELGAGLSLEILSRTPAGLSTTGALSFADLSAAQHEALWIQSSPDGSFAWGQKGEAFAVVPAIGSLSALPPPAAAAAPHVPVITPSKGKSGDLPPRLEDKPLPPF